MTLDQRAAFLDQLKRPIEEAPRDGSTVLGISDEGFDFVWWSSGQWRSDELNSHPVTHFLPLPKSGPVEFEVVPVGTVENTVESAYKEGYHNGLKHGKNYEGSYPNFSWIASDAREAAERSYLRGLETGAEVQRVEDEAK